MYIIAGIIISLVSLSGYVFSVHRLFKIPFRLTPLIVFNGVIIILYWASLADVLQPVTATLVLFGVILGLITLLRSWLNKQVIFCKHGRDSLFLFFGMLVIAVLCSLTGKPSVVDDYAWWGIVSKSIEMFQALPNAETSIYPRHLTYLPGLALFHQFFYTSFSDFHLLGAYLAQNLLLLALILALTDNLKKRDSIVIAAICVVLLLLFSGSVFQKLRVDHFLALSACTVVWLQFKHTFSWQRYAVIISIICSLYLIKEVGLLLSVFLVFVVSVDLLFSKEVSRGRKSGALLGCMLVLFYLIMQKNGWDSHCLSMGFAKFQGGINLEAIVSAFDLLGNQNSRNAFLIFLKAMLVGGADKIGIPYLVWYLTLGFFWYHLLKKAGENFKARSWRLIGVSLAVFIVYLAMNYVMQVAIFGLGDKTETTTSLARYVNIFFCWFAYFSILSYAHERMISREEGQRRLWQQFTLLLAGFLLVGSSLPDRQQDIDKEIENLVPFLSERVEVGSKVCISPGSISDDYLGFRLLYHLLPLRFNVAPFPGDDYKKIEQIAETCDYVLAYNPNDDSQKQFGNLINEDIEHKNLYKVLKTEPPTLKRAQ